MNNSEKILIEAKRRKFLKGIQSGKEYTKVSMIALVNLERRLIQQNKNSGKDQDDER